LLRRSTHPTTLSLTLPPLPLSRRPPPQTWCAGRRKWEAESLCLDCHAFTHRAYADPDFLLPEELDKAAWGGATGATA